MEENGGRDSTLLQILAEALNFRFEVIDPASHRAGRIRGSKWVAVGDNATDRSSPSQGEPQQPEGHQQHRCPHPSEHVLTTEAEIDVSLKDPEQHSSSEDGNGPHEFDGILGKINRREDPFYFFLGDTTQTYTRLVRVHLPDGVARRIIMRDHEV